MVTAVYLKTLFSAADTKSGSDNGYRVFIYKCLEASDEDAGKIRKGKTFTANGYFLGDIPTAVYLLNGTWKETNWGEQLKIDSFEERISKNKRGIMSFLCSPALKGVGEKTAKRIYDKFGDDTLQVMDEDITKLLSVKGITKRKLATIEQSYKQMRGAREIITTLAPYEIHSSVAMKIYERYKENALDIIKKHPYKLQENHGIGFLICDKIAAAFGFDMNSEERIKAAIEYALIRIETTGHCACTKEMLFKAIKHRDVLGPDFSNDKIEKCLAEMVKEEQIRFVRNLYFRAVTYHVECEVAQRIVELADANCNAIENVAGAIKRWEEKNKITLHPEQRKAVETALTHGFTVITGGAGRGKTTITKAIVDIRKQEGKKKTVNLLSPTGRAAKILSAVTGIIASTIHSLLHLRGQSEVEEIEIEVDDETIIVDEVSMLDLWTARSLLTAIQNGSQVIFIGDINQLPSVGCGAILRDIIESGVIPVIRLVKNYRQADSGSLIVDNGDRINAGDTHLVYDKSSFMFYDVSGFADKEQFEQSAKIMIALYREKIKQYGKEEVIVLSPHHHADTKSSVDNMNRYLQFYVNPHNMDCHEIEFRHQIFRLGDLVMQTANADGIANGDIGVITSVFKEDETLEVTFSDTKREYSGEQLKELELAYATSIHKSQGSQYKCVIVNLLMGHSVMLKRNLLYTAISRAKLEVHLVSTVNAINKAINTEDTTVRITLLKEKIQQLYRQKHDFIPLKEGDKTPFTT